MNGKLKILLLSCLLVLFTAVAQAEAVLYEGYLIGGGGGITASGSWNSTTTKFSWSVYDVGLQNGSTLWQYDYFFEVPGKDISHMIVEVSPNKTNDDFVVLPGSSAGVQVYGDEGGSNPNIPETLWGIKFENGALTMAASLQTTLAPVWGDFYAKDGKDGGIDVAAWNTGFTAGDIDPTDPPGNGSISYHILRPDTVSQVPEPSTMLLLSLSLLGLAGVRKRF